MPDKGVRTTASDKLTVCAGNTGRIGSPAVAAATTSARRRLLCCGVSAGIEDRHRLFAEHHDLITCQRMSEAEERLVPGSDLIVCGTQFDEGAMAGLLRHAKVKPETRYILFLCIRIAGGFDETLFQSVSLSSRALGTAGFIDVLRWAANMVRRTPAAGFGKRSTAWPALQCAGMDGRSVPAAR